jgi:hypothetical protein
VVGLHGLARLPGPKHGVFEPGVADDRIAELDERLMIDFVAALGRTKPGEAVFDPRLVDAKRASGRFCGTAGLVELGEDGALDRAEVMDNVRREGDHFVGHRRRPFDQIADPPRVAAMIVLEEREGRLIGVLHHESRRCIIRARTRRRRRIVLFAPLFERRERFAAPGARTRAAREAFRTDRRPAPGGNAAQRVPRRALRSRKTTRECVKKIAHPTLAYIGRLSYLRPPSMRERGLP